MKIAFALLIISLIVIGFSLFLAHMIDKAQKAKREEEDHLDERLEKLDARSISERLSSYVERFPPIKREAEYVKSMSERHQSIREARQAKASDADININGVKIYSRSGSTVSVSASNGHTFVINGKVYTPDANNEIHIP